MTRTSSPVRSTRAIVAAAALAMLVSACSDGTAQQLKMSGIEPHVDVVVDNFLVMPFLIAGSNRIALMQAQLAHVLAPPLGVRVLPPPFESVPLAEAFWWHPVYRDDPAHRWLRSALTTASQRLTGAVEAIRPADA